MAWLFYLIGLLLILPGFYSTQPLTEKEDDEEYDRIMSILQQIENAEKKEKSRETNFEVITDLSPDSQQREAAINKVVASTISSSSSVTPSQAFFHPTPARHIVVEKTGISLADRDFWFIVIVAGCSIAALLGIILAGVCWYKLNSRVKAASEVDYPAYGVTGPTKERSLSPGDRKLAQSAQMYHYQHQKQQMLAMEKANGEMKHDASEDESEEENEEGDYTVYECPGLAPAGEMEVTNPLFKEDVQTPVSPAPGDKE